MVDTIQKLLAPGYMALIGTCQPEETMRLGDDFDLLAVALWHRQLWKMEIFLSATC